MIKIKCDLIGLVDERVILKFKVDRSRSSESAVERITQKLLGYDSALYVWRFIRMESIRPLSILTCPLTIAVLDNKEVYQGKSVSLLLKPSTDVTVRIDYVTCGAIGGYDLELQATFSSHRAAADFIDREALSFHVDKFHYKVYTRQRRRQPFIDIVNPWDMIAILRRNQFSKYPRVELSPDPCFDGEG